MKKTISIILALILTLSIVSAAGLYGEAKDLNKKKITNRLTGAAVTKIENKITGDVIKAPKEKGNLKFTYDTDKKIVTIEGRIKTEGVMRNARNLYFEDFNINNNRETKYEFFKIQDDMLVLHLVSEKTKLGIAIPAIGKFSKNIILEFDDLKLKTLGVVAYRFSDIKEGTLKIELAGKPEVIEINNNKLKLNKFYEMIEFEEITAEQKELPKSNLILATGAATKSVKNKLNVDKYFNELFGTSPLTGAVAYDSPSTTDSLVYATFGTAEDTSIFGHAPGVGQPVADLDYLNYNYKNGGYTNGSSNSSYSPPTYDYTITDEMYTQLTTEDKYKLDTVTEEYIVAQQNYVINNDTFGQLPSLKQTMFDEIIYKLFGNAEGYSPFGHAPGVGQPVVDIKYKKEEKKQPKKDKVVYKLFGTSKEPAKTSVTGQPIKKVKPKKTKLAHKVFGKAKDPSPVGHAPGVGQPVVDIKPKDTKKDKEEGALKKFINTLFGKN